MESIWENIWAVKAVMWSLEQYYGDGQQNDPFQELNQSTIQVCEIGELEWPNFYALQGNTYSRKECLAWMSKQWSSGGQNLGSKSLPYSEHDVAFARIWYCVWPMVLIGEGKPVWAWKNRGSFVRSLSPFPCLYFAPALGVYTRRFVTDS
jgi:hypothetical protein